LKNLKVLAPFSIAGTASIFLVAIIMGIRYFDGSYDVTRNGRFVEELPKEYKPSFGTTGAGGALSPQILVLVCMLFEAFVAHYNSPRMFIELKQRTVPRFRTVVVNAFSLSGIIYILFSSFGYLTFGSSSDGYILNNFSTNDKLATVCRIAIAFTIMLTYPVVFIGFRDGVLDLLHTPMEKETSHYLNIVSVLLLMLVTLIAVFVRDLGALNAVGGGTLATAIVFVFPTMIYRKAVYDYYQNEPPMGIVREVRFTYVLMGLGILMGAVGVWMALHSK
jgi:amino acid permease